MSFPTAGQYTQAIISKNGGCLRELKGALFIPQRTIPFKVYCFGAGQNATVFKVNWDNKTYGIRCFLNNDTERITRAKSISRYLENVNESWKIDYRFLENEIMVNGKSYPLIQMSWTNGKDLNSWINDNLYQNEKLNQLQKKIVELSNSLEENNIGHGDIQSGNLLIEEIGPFVTLKLIDYDGLYIPALSHLNAIENGRAEFQHPSRNLSHFRSTIDRFSFIVLLTSIELLKYDKSLWKSPLQNGFNSGDNLLFSAADFRNPNTSELIRRSRNFKVDSLNFYLNQLEKALHSNISGISAPVLFKDGGNEPGGAQDTSIPFGKIKIESNMPAIVLNGFTPLGQTPLQLDKSLVLNKELNVSNGRGGIKRILISNSDSLIKVIF
jgi:hypothetical protein